MKRLSALLLSLLLAISLCACGVTISEVNSPTPTPLPAASPEPAPDPTPEATPERVPEAGELVRAVDVIPGIYIDARYASEDNFTGRAIYADSAVYLRYSTAQKLAEVHESLKSLGYSLCIWDGWRPVAAQFALWRACPDPVYVANPFSGVSAHCRGNTVDITLVTLDGESVAMPSDFDDFSSLADRDYSDVSPEAAENARLLEELMTAAGFRPYSAEWWHYTDNDAYDVLVSRTEPPVMRTLEGAALLDAPGGNTLAYLAEGTELAVLDEAEGSALVSSPLGYGYVELDKIG